MRYYHGVEKFQGQLAKSSARMTTLIHSRSILSETVTHKLNQTIDLALAYWISY
jgi:hypothetical protein